MTDGAGTNVSSSAGHIANVNPLRYRGYYYDIETGFYYLNSRYYDPETGRFINADGLIDNRGVITPNLFAYCLNNPINNVDSNGDFAISLTFMFVAAVVTSIFAVATVAVVVSQPEVQQAISNAVDATVTAVGNAINNTFSKSEDKSKSKSVPKEAAPSIPKDPPKKSQAVFPQNPYDFKPKGLQRITYVEPGTGKNGGIIKWEIPGTKTAIFEWNEDFNHGSHYHAMLIEWDNKHNGIHYRPGTEVPEPWNSMYFGG